MAQTFPISAKISYIVEERLISDMQDTNFAWIFDTPGEAEETLLTLVRANGDSRFYTVFTHIDN
jgi:hypothetical protein